MQRVRGLARRFRFPWRSTRQIRREVDDEIAFHIAEKVAALERHGMTPADAREEALRQFGDVETARRRIACEDRRGERYSRWRTALDDIARDTRHAWRSLRRTPGFTVVAVLVLAIGIGVVCAAFSLVNVMALKPVMIGEPDRVLGVFSMHPERRGYRPFSYSEYDELRERTERFSNLAAYRIIDAGVEEGDVTRRVEAALVSANYFETLGVPIARGRAFTLAEERGEAPPTAVVSHAFWVRNGADPDILGSVVRVNGEQLVVVGIAPRGFIGTMALFAVDIWVPLASMGRIPLDESDAASSLRAAEYRALLVLGRLEDGASAASAETELAALAQRIDANLADPNGARYTYVTGKLGRFSYGAGPTGDDGVLAGAVVPFAMSSVVLLIACLNLANMFLARGAIRRTEMAVRQSLGSGRARLVRQLLTEGLLLAALGGAVGLIWAYWATTWIADSFVAAVPVDTTLVVDLRPDVRVLLATAATCVVATLLFGLAPAWRVTGTDVLSGLKEGAGAVSFGRRGGRTLPSGRSVVLVSQLALSLAMLTAGGLLVRSALVAASAMPDFSLDSTLLVELDPSLAGYDEPRSRAVYARVMERLRSLPEVERAGLTSLVPLSGLTHSVSVRPAVPAPDEGGAFSLYAVIDDGYFDALGVPILRGRSFTSAEVSAGSSPRVAIIDEPLAERLFPDADALGRQIQIASSSPDAPTVMEIVGIAPGTPGPDFDPAPRSHLYMPFGQAYRSNMHVLVAVGERAGERTRLLETLRDTIREIDPALPVLSLTTLRELRDKNWSLWTIRIGGRVFTLLGAMALLLAMVGLYGVTAFLTASRTREIGVRMALGASGGDVRRQMLRESVGLTVLGLAAGWVLALAVGRLLSSMLYEVSAMDPLVLVSMTALLAAAAALASYLPARRASRIEPTAALRYE